MAALPEDDAPTMTGIAERRVELPAPIEESDGDDTTTAEAGPPAARPDQDHAHDAEDRTVQQQVAPPPAAGRKPAPSSAGVLAPAPAPPPAPPAPAAGPIKPVSVGARPAAAAPAKELVTGSVDLAEELGEDDEIEDSITATAPRIDPASLPQSMEASQSGRGLSLSIPGIVEIRDLADEDDFLDETEVRTRPGNVPLDIPAALRSAAAASAAPAATTPVRAPAPRPAAGRPPSMTPPSDDNDDSDDDDGVTREGPAPRVGSVPDLGIAIPPSPTGARLPVETTAPRLPRPIVDEPPTRPGLGAVDEPPTRPGVEGVDEPPTRPGLGEPPPRSKLGAAASKPAGASDTYANESDDDDDDDSNVTTRGHISDAAYAEDSVTTQAPAVPLSVVEAALGGPRAVGAAPLDDGTDGTTQRVTKARAPASSSPADGESESITTQAPGPLTNILRVIASGSSPSIPSKGLLEDDEPPENRTAVMANAPLKQIIAEISASARPPIRPTGGPLLHGPQGSAAPRLEPSSESGLRVARSGSSSDERASLGVLGISDGRPSGVGSIANVLAADGSVSASIDIRAHAATELAFPHGEQPSLHDVDLGKGPSYGLLVAIVAVISVIVPVTLFFVLRHGSETVTPGVPAEPASEIQKHDGVRAKGVRGKNGAFLLPGPAASASASASAAPSSAPSGKPGPGGPKGGFPFKR